MPPKGEITSQPIYEPQRNQPPKPPKMPQAYQEELQRKIKSTSESTLNSTQSNVNQYESLVSQDQRQKNDLPEQLHQRAQPVIGRNTEPTETPKRQQESSPHIKPQSPGHSDQLAANDETSKSHSTQSKQEKLLSPALSHDRQKESDDIDDISWMLPLIEGKSGGIKALSPPLDSAVQQSAVPYQHQKRVFDASHSFPSPVASSAQFASSGIVSSEQAIRQSRDSSSRQHAISTIISDNSQHQRSSAIYGHSSHSPSRRQERPRPSSTEPLNFAITPHEPQISASISTRQIDEEPEKMPSTTQPSAKAYNSSALGFGGPSDWEHLGDHQAEEVDDTDLYSPNRSCTFAKATVNSTELPAETLPLSDLQQQEQSFKKPVEPAPSSRNANPQSTSRLPSHVPFQSATVHRNPSRGTVKPVLGLQQENPPIVQNSETRSSRAICGAVHGYVEGLDVDESRRVWSKDLALSNDQPHSTTDPKSGSAENSSLRFLSKIIENKFDSSEVSSPVPVEQSLRLDDSAHQCQSAEVSPEMLLGTALIKPQIPLKSSSSISTLQYDGNELESTEASIEGARCLPASESATRQRRVADGPQRLNTAIHAENPKISSTFKTDDFTGRIIEGKLWSEGIGKTIEIAEFSPRSNDSIHQEHTTEIFVNHSPELELNNIRGSSVSSRETFREDQSEGDMSRSNDSILQQYSTENFIVKTPDIKPHSTLVSSALSAENSLQPHRRDEKPMLGESILQRHSTESLMKTNLKIGSSSARGSVPSFTGKGSPSQIPSKMPTPNVFIHPLNSTTDKWSNPNDALDNPRTASGQKDHTLQIEATEQRSESNDSVHQWDFVGIKTILSPEVGLPRKEEHSESRDNISPTGMGKDVSKKSDDTSAVETSINVSTSVQSEATLPSELVDAAMSSITQAVKEHSKEGQRQVADLELGTDAPPTAIETDNPYSELDAWGRASLNRYYTMLNEEANAKTDKEKLNIFMVFASRETRLRAVLYGADDGTTAAQPVPERNPSKHLAETLTKRSEKALPALPSLGEPQHSPMLDSTSEKSSVPQGIQSIPKLRSSALRENPRLDQPPGLSTSVAAESSSDDMQYSPGGRPIVARGQVNGDSLKKTTKTTVELTLRDKVSKVLTHVASLTNSIPSPGSDAPMVVSSEASVNPKKLAYVPLKYSDHGELNEYASNSRSAFGPSGALKESLDAGSNIAISSVAKHEEISYKSAAISFSEPVQNSVEGIEENASILPSSDEQGQKDFPLDLRRFVRADFDPLISVLPSSGKLPKDSVQLQDMKNAMDAVPDDFSFIHQSVVDWDTEAKKAREIHERERHVRQGESERKIDALFDDHEIGYGDISELESEFKSSEAARKADEDRAEYQTFLSSVFDVVWTRLHFEISQLTPLYDEYSRIVNNTLVGKDMFEGLATQFTLAPIMSLLLAQYQKLEIRHQKAFEAVLERDRRLKKTEVSPWYTLGNVAKVKHLEKQFDNAEKNAAVDYYKQRNSRASKLMDVLDHNTLRGVGANQDYMEAIMRSIRRIASGRSFASMPSSESGLGVEEVMKAKSITTILARSSEQIVQTFHVADMLLNASDYDLSIANAKLANADAKVFARLKEERTKEDQKLVGSLGHRLALIRDDSRKTHDEIVKLLLFLGVQNGHAHSSQKGTSSPPADPVRTDRVPNTP